jgi:uncharacterized protein with ParB-like and HNH nuclease domain
MEIKAEVKSITKLKDYFFIVPDYQREYVWKVDDQVEQFLIDIENEFEPKSDNQKSYFIGSIIIVENNGKFDVIDGQQRLTTIILSLCAFRDMLKPLELDSKQKKYLQTIQELLSDFDINTDESKLRLELQYEESKDFLSKLIENQVFEEVETGSIKKMKAAYESNCFRFDSALGGIGGCPMAKNDLVGNLATEEVISFFEKNNIDLKLNKEAWFDASRMASKIFI